MTEQKLPLHRKYRPESFDEIYGNKSTIKALRLKIEEGAVTTFLFHGKRGTGKTTAARITARETGAGDIDIHEYDVADVGLKDFAREQKVVSRFNPLSGGKRVTIYDECQDASAGFWNAMLKTLEEPPKGNYFILCTTNPAKLPDAIKSRCASFHFSPLNSKEAVSFLKDICKEEKVEIDSEVLEAVAEKTECIPREMLVLLDKVIDVEGDVVFDIIDSHVSMSVDSEDLRELTKALLAGKSWKMVSSLLKSIDTEPESTRYAIMNYIAAVLLNSEKEKADRAFLIIEEFKNTFIYSGRAGLYSACFACTKF